MRISNNMQQQQRTTETYAVYISPEFWLVWSFKQYFPRWEEAGAGCKMQEQLRKNLQGRE